MAKQLIVVVHGVGVREAGAATGQVSAALIAPVEGGSKPEAVPWLPHSTDDFLLAEEDDYSEGGLLRTFPAHLRRFRRDVPTTSGEAVRQERVIADFYWGDVAGTGVGGTAVLVGLVKIILGLSHAVRENAMDVFPGGDTWDRAYRAMARGAALIIHGPVVALNLVLFLAVVMTLLGHWLNGRALGSFDLSEHAPFRVALLSAAVAILLGFAMLRLGRVFLHRHLAGWIVLSGLLVLAYACLRELAPDVTMSVTEGLASHVFEGPAWDNVMEKRRVLEGVAGVATVLIVAMVLAWGLALAFAWVILLVSWRRGSAARQRSLLPQSIMLMSVLWLLLMTAGWTLVIVAERIIAELTGFNLPSGLSAQLVLSCLRLVTPAAVTILALALLAGYLHLRKGRELGGLFRAGDYLATRQALAERHRLIVGTWLLWALDGFLILTTLFFFVLVLPSCNLLEAEVCAGLRGANQAFLPYLVVATFVVVLGIALVGQRGLAAGIAIVTDVLVYLNDFSWRTREDAARFGAQAGRSGPPRTRLERNLGLDLRSPTELQGYWMRGRIHSRLSQLMKRLIADESPDEVVVLSHSQGTVIAINVIADRSHEWSGAKGKVPPISLVTMGSPYTHLYAHFFPSAFPDIADRPQMNLASPACRVRRWTNIFRVDDFVGTHIDTRTASAAACWPEEHPVRSKGHTNYWVDQKVIAILQNDLAFGGSDRE